MTRPNASFFIIAALIVVATFAVYWQVHSFEFLTFDDNEYVTENPNIRLGLSEEGIKWAFGFYIANWHPLTWLSHLLDYELFGLTPAAPHIINVLFHLANTVLLFWLFLRMTKLLWPSAFIAALFALHPLHVESVAWVAERKDVLSTFFWFLTMLAYLRYTENKTKSRYLTVIVLFTLGLMAKPMLVTLPFVLLLIDYWPLNRLNKNAIIEKLPLFALSACSSVVTFFAQRSGGALKTVRVFSLTARLENTVTSYVNYLGKMFWPARLAVFYPHPENSLTISQVAFAAIVLIFITFLVIRFRRLKWLTFGWLWYLGTLVPVIGLVQVGDQAMADRYTYIPLIGIFVIVGWAAYELFPRIQSRNLILASSAIVILSALAARTYSQLNYWRNNLTLYEHSLSITRDNTLLRCNLAAHLAKTGDTKAAIEQFLQCLKLEPWRANLAYNLGFLYDKQGDTANALQYYLQAVQLKPDYVAAHNNIAMLFIRQGNFDKAIERLKESLRIDPNNAGTHNNLGNLLLQQNRINEAITHLQLAVKTDPNSAGTHNNLGVAFKRKGYLEHALAQFNRAIQINPNLADVSARRDNLLAVIANAKSYYTQAENSQKQGNIADAVKNYRQALALVGDSPAALNNLAWLLATNPKVLNPTEAVGLAELAAELTGHNQPGILDTLAAAYAANGDFAKAVETAQKAVDLAKSSQLAETINAHLELYKKGVAYTEQAE